MAPPVMAKAILALPASRDLAMYSPAIAPISVPIATRTSRAFRSRFRFRAPPGCVLGSRLDDYTRDIYGMLVNYQHNIGIKSYDLKYIIA